MTDPPRHPDSNLDTGDDTGVRRPGRESTTTTTPPRWVKVSGIIALVVVLLFVILLLTGGGGGHGPSRHSQSGDAGGPTSSLSGLR